MSVFTTTKLAGHRVLVIGDSAAQQCILDSQEYDSLTAHLGLKDAGAKADELIRAHFAPLTDALSELEKEVNRDQAPDPAFEFVIDEGTQGYARNPRNREAYTVSKDTAVLRLLNSDDHSRLVWVGSDIEITAL